MARADLVVKGTLFQPDGTLARGAFSVREGRIAAMREEPALRTLDFGERLVAPGAVDAHVHFRDPGHPQKEDFGSGTAAAALGGVTTVMDMPNTVPPVFTREAFDGKLAIAAAKAHVDFGLYCGLDERGEALDVLPFASAMKVYLGATTGHLLVRDHGLVRRALVEAAKRGRTVAFHAESQACLERHAHLVDATFPSHAASRPPECEAEAIQSLVEAAAGTGARVHIAHLSTAAGLEAMRGTPFSAEVCPHHLLLTEQRLSQGGRFKMNPPLRAQEDAEALWRALGDGRIAAIASDHAPHTPAEKDVPSQAGCPSGVPGVQTLLPVLLPFAKRGRIALPRLLDASVAGARLFGIPRKGMLSPGHDADFAVYDLAAERPVRASEMASRAGWTPFEGMPAVFPTHVALRGSLVVEEGRLVGPAGAGRFVAPEAPRG
ncbi:MAG: dihydroorotase [Thermoplasmata archaeon]|jgi:dihydroorotase|nr:dihydroorotase [Thermoplasmata archaeon]